MQLKPTLYFTVEPKSLVGRRRHWSNGARLPRYVRSGFVLLLCALSSACPNGKVSREKAAQLIAEHQKLPFTDVQAVKLSYEERVRPRGLESRDATFTPDKTGVLLRLEQAGLVTYRIDTVSWECESDMWWNTRFPNYGLTTNRPVCNSPEPKDPPGPWRQTFSFRGTFRHVGIPTARGNKLLSDGNKFIVYRNEFGSVTGIVENPSLNIVEVQYTIVKSPTEAAAAMLNRTVEAQAIARSAIIRRYDDGWRVE